MDTDIIYNVFMKKASAIDISKLGAWCSAAFGPISITNACDGLYVSIYRTKDAKRPRFENRFSVKPICSDIYDYDNWAEKLWADHSDLICKEFNKWLNKFGK